MLSAGQIFKPSLNVGGNPQALVLGNPGGLSILLANPSGVQTVLAQGIPATLIPVANHFALSGNADFASLPGLLTQVQAAQLRGDIAQAEAGLREAAAILGNINAYTYATGVAVAIPGARRFAERIDPPMLGVQFTDEALGDPLADPSVLIHSANKHKSVFAYDASGSDAVGLHYDYERMLCSAAPVAPVAGRILETARALVREDVGTFVQPRESLVGRVNGLTSGMEDNFEMGLGDEHFYQTSIYKEWAAIRGFDDLFLGNSLNGVYWYEADIPPSLRERGIQRIFFDGSVSLMQLAYIEAVFELLPPAFFKACRLETLALGGDVSQYESAMKLICIGCEDLRASRKLLLGTLLHELGHTVQWQWLDLNMNDFVLVGSDEGIYKNEIYAIDWEDGAYFRKRKITEQFHEFMAEQHLIYRVDGPGLRAHIAAIKNEEQRSAYWRLYNVIKEKSFGGLEY